MDKILIITGGSKGLGLGIIAAYQSAGYHIFSLSRTKNESPEMANVSQISVDLSKNEAIENILTDILQKLNPQKITDICLINNAGTLGTITRVENYTPQDIQNTIYLNTVTPLILIATFIRHTQDWVCAKRIVNISSGAAKSPYYGWVNYCASKASVDMITQTVALEQQSAKYPVKIISIHPGIIETDMQAQIRQTHKTDFVDVERFIEFKNTGKLLDKYVAGANVFRIDHDKNIQNGDIVRV